MCVWCEGGVRVGSRERWREGGQVVLILYVLVLVNVLVIVRVGLVLYQ